MLNKRIDEIMISIFYKNVIQMAKTWKNIKPHSRKSRKRMKMKYGSKCFLHPTTMKYPVCNKYTGKQECSGHYAAQFYLNMNKSKLRKKRDKVSQTKKRKYMKLLSKSTKYTSRHCLREKK
tara:strand:+ start:386 stop:748 length:363 start_codon:yes stop_codon:yes gene_type:complete